MGVGKNATAKTVAIIGSVAVLATTWILVRGNPPRSPANAAAASSTAATTTQPAPSRASRRVPASAPQGRTRTRVS